MTLAVEKSFDWDTFTERFWDRRPVLYKAVDAVPFAESEVFRAAVLGSRPPHPLAVPGNLQFLVRRRQQTRPHDYLPELSDGSFDGYEQRMADRLGGQRYALVVHRFHSFSHPLWDRAQRFYAGLWERVGQPTHSAGSTMFHGSYEHSPVGVHQDRFATFMFCVRGTKRMRFWAERPWSDPVHTVLDYQPYLDSSFVAEVEPGDLLYWPSRYYHVGESAGDAPATSVNVGIPRREHRPYYEIKDLFRGTRPTASAPLFTPDAAPGGRLAAELPTALADAVDAFATRLDEDRFTDRATELALRVRTAGGFWPTEPPAEPRPLDDDTPVRGCAPLLPAPGEGPRRWATGGHVTSGTTTAEALAVLHRLDAGEAVRVGELPATGRAEVRRLLEELESFRAVIRVDAH
ncbi:cupin domain-containing protein [Streptomyces sp. SH5]|uniref:JmjC domain-containing protein n=1 Tax=Streptomyces sp. SH5 TaxID=3041765 RepID=UPI002477D0D8|nr:cupin domain-containing protein [Streptomyces sp. SH5]WGP08486.1 cupin domain-containing protein [Streptomyces sp. SH5]